MDNIGLGDHAQPGSSRLRRDTHALAYSHRGSANRHTTADRHTDTRAPDRHANTRSAYRDTRAIRYARTDRYTDARAPDRHSPADEYTDAHSTDRYPGSSDQYSGASDTDGAA